MRRTTDIGLGAMVRAGGRALSTYTGTLFAVFLVQAIVAWGAGVAMQGVLMSAFGDRPMFDDGVDGDLIALAHALRDADLVIAALGWLAAGAILLWILVSWFLIAGVVSVVAEQPRDRRATARCFGAGGAASYFVLVRLALLSMVGHLFVIFVALLGLGAVAERIDQALTFREVALSLLAGLTPSLVLLVLLWTIVDYARVELVVRRTTHDRLGATMAFGRAAVFVLQRPVALAHHALGLAAFLAISVLYAWASHGRAMLGTSGAVSLLVVRQGLALVRLAIDVAVIAGQVELGLTRTPPARAASEP